MSLRNIFLLTLIGFILVILFSVLFYVFDIYHFEGSSNQNFSESFNQISFNNSSSVEKIDISVIKEDNSSEIIIENISNGSKNAKITFISLNGSSNSHNDDDNKDSYARKDLKDNEEEQEELNKFSFSTYIYSDTINSWEAEDLSKTCADMKITKVYLSIKKSSLNQDQDYTNKISNLVTSFHKNEIFVAALLLSSPNVYANRDKISESLDSFNNYQNTITSEAKFDEISFDIEPHMLKEDSGYDSYQGNFWQGSDGYGIGSSNDILLEQTQEILSEIRSKYEGQISQAITHFFHDKDVNGLTNFGNVNLFLDNIDEAIIMDYDNRKEKIISRVQKELEDSTSKESIVVCLKTKPSSSSTESISDLSYEEFISLKKSLINEFKNYSSFSGLCIFEFESFYKIYSS